jgi:hypothetical protein
MSGHPLRPSGDPPSTHQSTDSNLKGRLTFDPPAKYSTYIISSQPSNLDARFEVPHGRMRKKSVGSEAFDSLGELIALEVVDIPLHYTSEMGMHGFPFRACRYSIKSILGTPALRTEAANGS